TAAAEHSVRRVEPRPQRLIDLLRVRLAARSLHHLPDEEAKHLRLAVAVLLHLLGIGAHHVVDERLDRLAVRDLHEPAALDDLPDVAALVPQRLEDLFRDLPGDRSVLDPVEERRELLGRDARLADLETAAIQRGPKPAQP